MKQVTYFEKSLLLGDEAASLLLEYAAAIAYNRRADTVMLTALEQGGAEVEVTYLLNAGTMMMAESSSSRNEEPNNHEAIGYMKDRMPGLYLQSKTARLDPSDIEGLDQAMLD